MHSSISKSKEAVYANSNLIHLPAMIIINYVLAYICSPSGPERIANNPQYLYMNSTYILGQNQFLKWDNEGFLWALYIFPFSVAHLPRDRCHRQ